MKLKLTILTLIALCSLNVSAQKKPVQSRAKARTTTANTKVDAKANASKIIQFSNSVIELGNSYSQSLKNYNDMLGNADSYMKTRFENPDHAPQFINCNVVSVQPRQQAAYTSASKLVGNFPEKADIIRHVAEGEGYAKSIATWCAALSKYNADAEFKEDNGYVKHKAIRDSLDYYIAKASDSWRSASKNASDAGNRAELILLEGSPIASFVIPMKTDLTALESIIDMFRTESPDIEAIKLALAEEKVSIEKNKDVSTKDVSKLRDLFYKEVYENFYRQCSAVVRSLDTVADRLQEKEPDMENINSWFGSASGNYRKVVEEYNRFVSQ